MKELFVVKFTNGNMVAYNQEYYQLPDALMINHKKYSDLRKNIFISEPIINEAKIITNINTTKSYTNITNPKLPKSIDKETYDKLSSNFQSFYSKQTIPETKEESIPIITVADVKNDYNPKLFENIDNKYQPFVLPDYDFSCFDESVKYYLPHMYSGKNVFNKIVEILQPENKKSLSVDYSSWSNTLTINIWKNRYNGKTRKSEILTRTGRHYANPKYREIPSYPETSHSFTFSENNNINIIGTDYEDTINRVRQFVKINIK
jgi:hypothetical protein